MDRETKSVAARSGPKTGNARKTSPPSAASQLRAARAQQAAVNAILRGWRDGNGGGETTAAPAPQPAAAA